MTSFDEWLKTCDPMIQVYVEALKIDPVEAGRTIWGEAKADSRKMIEPYKVYINNPSMWQAFSQEGSDLLERIINEWNTVSA